MSDVGQWGIAIQPPLRNGWESNAPREIPIPVLLRLTQIELVPYKTSLTLVYDILLFPRSKFANDLPDCDTHHFK